jgi:site-specific recombinase XerD
MTHIDDFCRDHHERENIGERRRKAQRLTLTQLEAWLTSRGRALLEIDEGDFRDWSTELRASNSAATVRWKMMMIRPFLRWAWRKSLIGTDRYLRLMDVEPPRGANVKGLPRPYSRPEIQDFWRDVEATFGTVDPKYLRRFARGTSQYKRVRQHARRLQVEAIASLGLHCGLRRHEIRAASLDDLHHDNAYIPVAGKRDANTGEIKYRQVPYAEAARRRVTAWLKFREQLGPEHDHPWLSLHWNNEGPLTALSETRFNLLLNGVGRGWELHRLRHTCATERLRAGMNIEALKEFLGHATIQQTLAYAKIIRADVLAQAEETDGALEDALEPPPVDDTKKAA